MIKIGTQHRHLVVLVRAGLMAPTLQEFLYTFNEFSNNRASDDRSTTDTILYTDENVGLIHGHKSENYSLGEFLTFYFHWFISIDHWLDALDSWLE